MMAVFRIVNAIAGMKKYKTIHIFEAACSWSALSGEGKQMTCPSSSLGVTVNTDPSQENSAIPNIGIAEQVINVRAFVHTVFAFNNKLEKTMNFEHKDKP